MFFVTKTKECRGIKKKKRVCPFLLLENSSLLSPPWDPWIPFSSLGTPDFFSTCLGIDSLSIKLKNFLPIKFSSVQLLSHVRLFATPWTAAYQAPPSMGFSMARVLEWVAIAFSVWRRREEQTVFVFFSSTFLSLSHIKHFYLQAWNWWLHNEQLSLNSVLRII